MARCMKCRFWSGVIAKVNGGSVKAVCLSRDSNRCGQYTHQDDKCNAWASGHLGAIDEPGSDPLRYQKGSA